MALGYPSADKVPHHSTLYSWLKEKETPVALRDGRLENAPPSKVPDWQLALMVLELHVKPNAKTTAIVRHIGLVATQQGWKQPQYDAIHRLRKRISKAGSVLDMVAALRLSQFYLKYGLVIFRAYSHSNARWEIDWCQLDVWVISPEKGFVKPFVLLAVDCASRMIMGWLVTPNVPDTADYVRFLRFCFLPKSSKMVGGGLPGIVQTDNALIFKCADVVTLFTDLGIKFEQITPHCPAEDGIAERAIQTLKNDIKEEFVHGLTRANLVTRDERFVGSWEDIQSGLADWAFEKSCVRKHSALGMTPYRHWHTNLPSPDAAFADVKRVNRACLVSTSEKVYREGVPVKGSFYIAPQLGGYIKRYITVYHNPDETIHTVIAVLGGDLVDLVLNTNADHALQNALTDERRSAAKAIREANRLMRKLAAKNLAHIAPGSAKALARSKVKPPKRAPQKTTVVSVTVPTLQKAAFLDI